jgi:hypothetical protein
MPGSGVPPPSALFQSGPGHLCSCHRTPPAGECQMNRNCPVVIRRLGSPSCRGEGLEVVFLHENMAESITHSACVSVCVT